MEIEMKECSICGGNIDIHYTEDGEVYWSDGHNAQPINDGRWCDDCNETVVMPVRLNEYMRDSDGSTDTEGLNEVIGALIRAKKQVSK